MGIGDAIFVLGREDVGCLGGMGRSGRTARSVAAPRVGGGCGETASGGITAVASASASGSAVATGTAVLIGAAGATGTAEPVGTAVATGAAEPVGAAGTTGIIVVAAPSCAGAMRSSTA